MIGVVMYMGFHACERNNRNERKVGLMGGVFAYFSSLLPSITSLIEP